MERLHRERVDAGLLSAYDPSRPWDDIWRMAAEDDSFWTEHVERTAFMMRNHFLTRAAVEDQGSGAVQPVRPPQSSPLRPRPWE